MVRKIMIDLYQSQTEIEFVKNAQKTALLIGNLQSLEKITG